MNHLGISDQSGDKLNQRFSRRIVIAVLCLILLSGILGWRIRQQGWQKFKNSLLFANQPRKRNLQPPRQEFDFSNSVIPPGEIQHGGPPKDGIPALSNPEFLTISDAEYLKPDDRVISVMAGKEARAYPLKILNYHEIVNDRIGETPIAVTYCPLCDSSVVFDRRTTAGEREFGVSGLLFNSNVLMYDRGSPQESLWSQLMTAGVAGPGAKQKLKTFPLEVTTWKDWASRYPDGKVLSDQTGHARDYRSSPYQPYFETPQLMFPVKHVDKRLPAKTPVLGVWNGTKAIAFPLNRFSIENPLSRETINGKKFEVRFNPQSKGLQVLNAEDGVEWMYTFWFAWAAFHPQTEIYGSEKGTN
ncbi:hypothetical protein Pan153_52570 [Gimesia panareensis]|uniref:DUF3179 domain-containing protein n=1 Tax=Gimesia panareensis TaxID=2527978 RepID=A0A518FW79_9PLAN|nr:DUF3179 domain-containing protein [Gimesia panareensis]QDV20581.1 hypothetical protein Pan153_52570 [Gimesia panareensis]